jgi:pSer/pThr/pTyr-binding forkhead associated (FHA) protein
MQAPRGYPEQYLPVGPADGFPRDAAQAPARVLRGFLVAYGTNPNGDFWPLTGGRHAIGRLGSSDTLEIPIQDPTVSSRHASLIVDSASGSIVVEDTGSTNGTFVNDEPIGRGGRRDLRDGDRLRIGGFTTIVKVIGRV